MTRLEKRHGGKRQLKFSLPSLTPVERAILAPYLTREPEPPALVTSESDCFNIRDLESRLPLRPSPAQHGLLARAGCIYGPSPKRAEPTRDPLVLA